MIKRFLPRSLLGRSLLIIVTPLVLLQVVSALIFFESHWNKVSLRLARGLAGDIASLIDVMDENPGPENRKWIFDLAARNMGIMAAMKEGATVATTQPVGNDRMERILIRVVTEIVARPFQIDTESLERREIVDVTLAGSVLRPVTTA